MNEERMRAVVIASHGGVEVLDVREVERPRALGDRVRVRVHAAALNRVYGTARTPEKLERAREFGLNEGVVVGDEPQVFADAVREWTRGAGVHIILDLVGASYLAANLDALALRGRLLLVGTLGGAKAMLDFSLAMRKRLRITGTVLRARTAEEKAHAVKNFATHVVPLLTSGTLRPVVDSFYSIEEVRAAHERLESNKSFGKIVLKVISDE